MLPAIPDYHQRYECCKKLIKVSQMRGVKSHKLFVDSWKLKSWTPGYCHIQLTCENTRFYTREIPKGCGCWSCHNLFMRASSPSFNGPLFHVLSCIPKFTPINKLQIPKTNLQVYGSFLYTFLDYLTRVAQVQFWHGEANEKSCSNSNSYPTSKF